MELPAWSGKVIAALCVAGAFMFGLALWSDINIEQEQPVIDAPDIIVERFSFRRTIDDRIWDVDAISAEHREGIVNAVSIDVKTDEPDSMVSSSFQAERGSFLTDSSEMFLVSTDGVVTRSGEDAYVRAPVASYDSVGNNWAFPFGAEMSSERISAEGNIASIDETGVFYFGEGVSAQWHIE